MKTKKQYLKVILFTFHLSLLTPLCVMAQPKVMQIIKKTPSYASCNYHIYPDSITTPLTPSPEGKQPFYVSHYGRHGSRYISSRSGYDIPYMMMLHADSLDELTPAGRKVLHEMNLIMRDTEDRWGELTGYGKVQSQNIGRRTADGGELPRSVPSRNQGDSLQYDCASLHRVDGSCHDGDASGVSPT